VLRSGKRILVGQLVELETNKIIGRVLECHKEIVEPNL